jgi:anti-sigma factor RsiW
MNACPDKELLLHALADNELDAKSALEIEAHVAGCAGCAAELAAIRDVKAALATKAVAYQAPPNLLARFDEALAEATAPPPRPRRVRSESWVLGGSITALAASLALFALMPTGASLQGQLVDAQIRSLQGTHLVDVVTSDRHVVKPWFNGKVDFAPPVVDLIGQGYPLVGGRLDHLAGHDVAAIVYRRRAHVINLFVWKGDGPAAPTLDRRDGYSLAHWSAGGLTYWAVSDVDSDDLMGFQREYVAATK